MEDRPPGRPRPAETRALHILHLLKFSGLRFQISGLAFAQIPIWLQRQISPTATSAPPHKAFDRVQLTRLGGGLVYSYKQ